MRAGPGKCQAGLGSGEHTQEHGEQARKWQAVPGKWQTALKSYEQAQEVASNPGNVANRP